MYVRQLEGEIRELKNRLDEVSIKEGKEKMEECGEEMSKK
jgi:hypothetical protein